MHVLPVINGYKIIELLGSGGFGMVYLARQESTGQKVAIKVLRLDEALDEQAHRRKIERFERETQLCAGLHHPYIVKLLDKGQQKEGKQLYAVYEFVPGETLKSLLSRRGAFSAVQAGELMGQVLDALACAHAQGVVHRDLKPQNIMISTTGTRPHAKVLDFGIGAFLPGSGNLDYKSLTLTQEALGTPSYSAPEQLRGEPPTIKSDLYAWGLVLIECLTGHPVMHGSSLAEIFHKQLNPSAVPLPPVLADHPLGNLLRRVLQKNPSDRAGDAIQLYSDLKRINLNNLVGELKGSSSISRDTLSSDDSSYPATFIDRPLWSGVRNERRQITVLCFSLRVTRTVDELELEVLEALQRDQLNSCVDTGIRFGGHLAGMLGDTVMMYFGYPYVSDNDARRAARTALEIAGQVRRRSALLESRQNVRLTLHAGMHTGIVVVNQENNPTGITPNIAMRIQRIAQAGEVLLSETSRRVLEQHLEIESTHSTVIGTNDSPIAAFRLIGERLTEAFYFFRTTSTDQDFVGREQEKETILALWGNAKRLNSNTVLVDGEPGIGKSRLVYEVRQKIRQENFSSVDCRCLPEYKNNALHPFLELLKAHLRLNETSSPDEAIQRLLSLLEKLQVDKEQALPILCAWLSLPQPENHQHFQPAPDKQKIILLNSLAQFVLSLGENNPFVLIIEDLHWIDPTSMELLERIIAAQTENGVLILLTARPEFEAPWNDSDFTHIALAQLSPTQTQSLIGAVLCGKPIDKHALRRISERTDGIPLFIEELTHTLLESNMLVERNGIYHLDESVNNGSLPITLLDSLNERLDRLGSAKETAQLASALGREFNYSLLIASAYGDEAATQSDIEKLLGANLIYRKRRVKDESYIFRHALIRDAAYDSMPTDVRQQAHSRIASSILSDFQQIATARPAEVAMHFSCAGEYENAVNYGIMGARKALELSVNEEILTLGTQVLDWGSRLTDTTKKIQVEFETNSIMFPALMALKGLGSEELVNLSRRNDELHKALVDVGHPPQDDNEDMTYLSQWVLFQDHHFRSRRDAAIELGERIVHQARAHNHTRRELLVLPLLGQAYHLSGDLIAAKERCERAIALYDDENDMNLWMEYGVEPKSQALFLLSHILCCLGFPDAAKRASEESLLWAKKTGCSMSADGSVLFAAMVAFHSGDAETIIGQNRHFNNEERLTSADQWIASYWKACYEWAVREHEFSNFFISALIDAGRYGAVAWWEAMLADTELYGSDVNSAIERLTLSIQRCENNGELGPIPVLQRMLAMAYVDQENSLTQRSGSLFKQAIESTQHQGAIWLELDAVYHYSKALLKANRPEEVLEHLGPILDKVSEGYATPLYVNAKNLFDSVVMKGQGVHFVEGNNI